MVAETIAVVPYDPDWRRSFEVERALLERALAPWLEGGVHHVGSTAVPGLAAKPTIDMIAGVRDLDDARAAFAPLRDLAYVPAPHRPAIALHFAKPCGSEPQSLKAAPRFRQTTHNLHLTLPGSDLWRERLAFRDALLQDPQLAAEYEALKLRLVREHGDDPGAYTAGKRAFVARVLASAGVSLGPR